ncbi:MAG: hypothetical protein MZV63_34130 [Marinilabiliales bacterium]|nr:hypothetical protein [Marinilabiliales bacterium]
MRTQVVKDYPDPLLINRIGEQKTILNDIIMLLSPFCKMSSDYTALCKDMDQLREKYSAVTITYTQGEPETVEVDGRLTVIQNEESKVEMTAQQLSEIIEITQTIRNNVILSN